MPLNKKYVITAITLGAIAASSAVLIGVTNLITKDKIAQNEKNRINAGIVEIFGEGASITSENTDSYGKYVIGYYVVGTNDYAFRTSGSNMYGKISLLVGFTKSNSWVFKGISVVVDEQTYASTLEDEYIAPVNSGDRDYTDVKCGATYGATTINDMINEVKEYVNGWN